MGAKLSNPVIWAVLFGIGIVALILLLSLFFAFCVALAGREYSDKLQKRYQKAIRELLPGKNCGDCGCETCDFYARSVLFGVEGENACPPAEDGVPQEMLFLVKQMQGLMEDPKPIRKRKKRSFWIFGNRFE